MSITRLAPALALATALAACSPLQPRPDMPAPPPPPPAELPDEWFEPDPEPRPVTPPPSQQWPRNAAEVSGPAVTSLLQQAEREMEAGRPDGAVVVLERAMRIEPRNAFVWAALGEGYLATDQLEQAEVVASRANSYARGNPWLEARNWFTIAQAREASGDAVGAEQAREQLRDAQDRQPPF